MHVVVGLGNPGKRYAETRHNVGFAAVDELAQRFQVPFVAAGRCAQIAGLRVGNQAVLLVKPLSYMNRSGEAVARLGIAIRAPELVVAHDDLDLACGRIRVKLGGGIAGHRGLESIVSHWGNEFVRVRVGIGRPKDGNEVPHFVLAKFGSEDYDSIRVAVQRAADAVECIVRQGPRAAMNAFNMRGAGDAREATPSRGRK